MLELFRNRKVLVVAAHPDDELLGQGGSIHRLNREWNCQCFALILGEGITSRGDTRDPSAWQRELQTHQENMREAARSVGYQHIECLSYPDNRFDSVDLIELVKEIERRLVDLTPDIILTHHSSDTNIDHRLTFEAVMVATRPVPNSITRTILTFETPSSTEWQSFDFGSYFRPNFYIPITEVDLEAKLEGMAKYIFESRSFPHPRSPEALRALAQTRGVQIGHELAEAFMLIRSF